MNSRSRRSARACDATQPSPEVRHIQALRLALATSAELCSSLECYELTPEGQALDPVTSAPRELPSGLLAELERGRARACAADVQVELSLEVPGRGSFLVRVVPSAEGRALVVMNLVGAPCCSPEVGPSLAGYRLLTEVIDAVHWELDLATFCFTHVSPSAERLLGYPAADWLRPGFWTSHLHPDDCEWATRFCQSRTQAGQDHRFEYRMIAADGRIVLVEDVVFLVHDEAGQPVGLRGVLTDVTRRDQLRAERDRLAHAVAQASDAIVVTDLDDRLEYVNAAFTRLSGYTSAEALGRTPRLLRSGLHPPSYYQDLRAALRRGETWSGAFVNRRKDGSLYEVLAAITPVGVDGGPPTHYVGIQRDVTGLRQAQKLELLGELVAGIAHEVNNPVAYLRLNLGVLREFVDDVVPVLDAQWGGAAEPVQVARLPWPVCRDTLPRLLAGIAHASDRIASLVTRLKEFASPEPAELGPFDLKTVIDVVTDFVRPELSRMGVRLSVVQPAAPPQLQGSPERLEQVLLNLILNAAQAMEGGGEVRLVVDAEASRGLLGVCVEDEGPGIPEAEAARVFEPFYTTRRGMGGTGLGLAICKQILTQLGGSITQRNVQPHGACFRLELPVAS